MILGLLLGLAAGALFGVSDVAIKYLTHATGPLHGLRRRREPVGHRRLRRTVGSGPLAISARVIAFCLVIAGAALMPSHSPEQREPEASPSPIRGAT